MTHSYNNTPSANYTKTLTTLEESLRTGQFARYSQKKKQELWNQLCSYASQLGIRIKTSIVAACLAAGLCLSTPTEAQISFTEQTGAANPLNGVSGYNYIRPTFVDIDGDGDNDVFIGSYPSGSIRYFENTGTSTAPVFVEQTGASNPLDGVSASLSSPAFADIDGDGDQDFFMGSSDGTVIYYENTGTPIAPVFTLQSGALNPLDGVDVGYYSSPVFKDIDGDGDLDVFIGSEYNNISYYENTGTLTVPAFTQQTGTNNPFDAWAGASFAVLTFADIDKDGDLDAFIGTNDGLTSYYQNTGTSGAPVFTLQAGALNPLDGVNVGNFSAPATVDIDGDGNVDVFIGNNYGQVSYYKNTSTALPLQLIDFTGNHHPDYNQLQWKTADEVNTHQFGVEASSNGASFTTIATIKAAGGGNNSYSYQDKTAYNNKVYYRLKMMDIDGHFTYSNIIWINSRQTAAVSLYPNPAREVVNISMGNSGMINTVANLYSSNGILLQKILITGPQQQINIHKLAKGSYVLKFADGRVSTFIKE